jgi:hypothetical protein
MWRRFLVVGLVLVADLGSGCEGAANTATSEGLISGAQFIVPFAITGSSDNQLPFAELLFGGAVPRNGRQTSCQTFVCITVIRNPSLTDFYYLRAPPVSV